MHCDPKPQDVTTCLLAAEGAHGHADHSVPSGTCATQERQAQTCDHGDSSGSVLARHNLINPSDSVLDAIVFPSGEMMAR